MFQSSGPTTGSTKYSTQFSSTPDSMLGQIPAWLHSFTARSPSPFRASDPLVRTLFAFFFDGPHEYIEILLPLLDQTPDGPIGESSNYNQLTNAEVLSLDIYAHWLVLLVLTEAESWWGRNFPIIGLQGLIQRYKKYLIERSSLNDENIGGKWWPGGMVEVITQVGQWKQSL